MAASAGNAAKWTTKVLNKDNARFLESLWYKKKIRKYGIELVHSTPVYPQGYRYVKNAATLSYDILNSSITSSGTSTHDAICIFVHLKRGRDISVFMFLSQLTNSIIDLCMVERQ